MRQLPPEQMERLLWSLARGLALSDHMGDAWNSFTVFWEILGMEPLKFDEDDGMPNLKFIESRGGVSLYDVRREESRTAAQTDETPDGETQETT